MSKPIQQSNEYRYDTEALAVHMMKTGKAYTATTLARELGLSAQYVTGKLNNIHRCRKKYTVTVSEGSPRLYRVHAVRGVFNPNAPTAKLLNSVWG